MEENNANVESTPANENLTDAEKLIAELEAKAQANLDLAKYQKAEFENYKRRTQNAVTAAFQDGQSYVINLLLPIFDGVVEAGKKNCGSCRPCRIRNYSQKAGRSFPKIRD